MAQRQLKRPAPDSAALLAGVAGASAIRETKRPPAGPSLEEVRPSRPSLSSPGRPGLGRDHGCGWIGLS